MWFVAIVTVSLAGCSRQPEWTTPSGLQIKEIREGEGSLARRGDIMSVIYTASYVEGKQFDSQLEVEYPYKFRVGFGEVLRGLDEGVSTMRVGGKRELILPPELAFGTEGQGLVPPGTWVKFEVELLEIKPGPIPPDPWSEVGHDISVTNTGLQYIDFVIGEGKTPRPSSEVVVHYTGFLDDGTVFDSSYSNGMPIRFLLEGGELIPGWIEGIMSMKEGGRRKLIIPPHLAYGEQGYGRHVPANATLTYDVYLITIRDAEE